VLRLADVQAELCAVLINACTGACFFARDDSCPLSSVTMVAVARAV
jgi:hypothetical protein